MTSKHAEAQTYQYLLGTLRQQLNGDLFFVCLLGELGTASVAVLALDDRNTPADLPGEGLWELVGAATTPQTHSGALHVDQRYPVGVVHVVPLSVGGVVVGGVLSGEGKLYTDADALAVAGCLTAAAALAENALIRERTATQQKMLVACQLILKQRSVQQMMDTLEESVLGEQISVSAILLYGPAPLAGGPPEYVEVAATWGQGLQSGYGLGARFYVDAHRPLLERLVREGVVLAGEVEPGELGADALLLGLLKAEVAQDWMLLALQTEDVLVGVWLITSKDAACFGPYEVEKFQMFANVLARGLIIKMLQQQERANKYGRLALSEAVNDGVILASPSTNGAVVLLLNERFREMFNYRHQPAHRKLEDVVDAMEVPPSVKAGLEKSWKSHPFRDQDTLHGEFEMISHRGQPTEILWYSAPIYNPESDDVFARVYIFHDATPERAAVQVRSAFLSRVSHELRTPLTSISGFTQFILEEVEGLPPLAREYTEIIQESAEHLKHVFTDLIEITRVNSGQVTLNLFPCDLARVVQTVLRRQAAWVAAAGLSVTVEASADAMPVLADPDRLTQVISLLLQNVVTHALESNSLRIQISNVPTPTDLPAHAPVDVITPAVMLEIQDGGEGIPPEEASSVFEPFFRGQAAQARQATGAGLGLTLAQSIVELHRGAIWAVPASPQNPGGHICFVVPAIPQP